MTAGQGFHLHPLTAQDIIDIWEYIGADSPLSTIAAGLPRAIKRPSILSRNVGQAFSLSKPSSCSALLHSPLRRQRLNTQHTALTEPRTQASGHEIC
jgi:hypothetical protein